MSDQEEAAKAGEAEVTEEENQDGRDAGGLSDLKELEKLKKRVDEGEGKGGPGACRRGRGGKRIFVKLTIFKNSSPSLLSSIIMLECF